MTEGRVGGGGSTPRSIVIGLGNRFRSDDAAGLEVARSIRAVAGLRAQVVELEGEPIEILDAWAGFDTAILVDAVSGHGQPGAVHEIDVTTDALPAGLRGKGTHAFSLADVVELARATDRLPERVVIFGIEGESFSAGEGLTDEVRRAVEAVAPRIERLLRGSARSPESD